MDISAETKAKLVSEIEFVLERMKQESDITGKLYYFSAVFGIMNRIFNLEYSSDLIFVHSILSATHAQINARLQTPEKAIPLPPEVPDKLFDATAELLEVIEKDGNPYEVLKKFAVLGYVTGGNGYYLYQKGLLKL